MNKKAYLDAFEEFKKNIRIINEIGQTHPIRTWRNGTLITTTITQRIYGIPQIVTDFDYYIWK